MATIALQRKRKNIDLPVETLQKLSIVAAEQGKSLKSYIESILIKKAETLNIQTTANPSPSNDTWFDDPDNMASVMRGIEDVKHGRSKTYTAEEIKKLLDIWWKKTGQRKDLLKILSLLKKLEEHPTTGTGQVEQLKGNLSGYWSRRINKHFRTIYAIHEDIVTVEVISARKHYDNK